jgi:ATP-dependent Clp protease protease subunit
MPRCWSPDTASMTWPWPPEVPRRPDQPTYPPETPGEPSPPSHPSPTPILPSWEEPDPDWAERRILDRLLDQRVILISGRLDAQLADRAMAQLLLLDRTDDTRPIELHLSCRGSDLEPSLALAATVDLARAQVRVVVTGTVSGPALAVLCAAPQRVAHRHATFVLTLPHASAHGSATTVGTQAEEHKRAVAQLVERIATASGRSEELVDQDLRSGHVLSAEEAESYGLVDRLA